MPPRYYERFTFAGTERIVADSVIHDHALADGHRHARAFPDLVAHADRVADAERHRDSGAIVDAFRDADLDAAAFGHSYLNADTVADARAEPDVDDARRPPFAFDDLPSGDSVSDTGHRAHLHFGARVEPAPRRRSWWRWLWAVITH